MRGRICDRKGSRGALLALGLLPQVADGIDSGGFIWRDGALRGGCGDASRGLRENGLSRKLDWDNTLGLDMREERTHEGEGECATLS